jgi:hypothetical protein
MDSQNLTHKQPKKLTLDQLKTTKSIFAGRPVPEKVQWSNDGEDYEIDVFVRPYNYDSAVAHLDSLRTGTDTTATRIAYAIVDDAGTPIFTPADITGESGTEHGAMSQEFVMALLGAIYRANHLGKPQAQTPSTKKRKRGVSLSATGSVAEQLQKPAKT